MVDIKFLFILIICISVTSCSDNSSSLSPLSSDASILAFGDSLTYGTGAGKNQDYPSVLANLSNLHVINEGIPGEISSKGMERLPTLLDEHNPNLVILIHGGNDMLRKLPRANLKQNLSSMIQEIQQRDIQVVMLGVPEPGIFLKSAELYEELANEKIIPSEFSLLADILEDKSLKSDVAHPNAEGYQLLAQGIFDFLKRHGAIIE